MRYWNSLSSWSDVAKCTVTIASVGLTLAIVARVMLDFTMSGSDFSLALAPNGGIQFQRGKQTSQMLVFVSAADLWADSGVELAPNQSVRIAASGRVNLAIHRLVEAAIDDRVLSHPWVGPDGLIGDGARRAFDPSRWSLRVDRSAPPGSLIASVVPIGNTPPSHLLPRPTQMTSIGSENVVSNTTGKRARLYLTVNDTVLDRSDTSRQAYLDGPGPIEGSDASHASVFSKAWRSPLPAEQMWDDIVEREHFDIWYDDNAGGFHVIIDFEHVE